MNAPINPSNETPPRNGRLVWIAIGIGLVLAVLLVTMIAKQRAVFVSHVAGASAVPVSSPAFSAGDAARRAAIAKLGPIKHRDGINAADFYKQAIALFKQLSPEDQAALRTTRKKLDPKIAAALFVKIQTIMELLRKAQGANYSDWGARVLSPDNPEEADAFAAEINTINDLAAIAQWDANYLLQSGSDGGLQDLVLAEQVSHSGDPSVMSYLIETAMHTRGLSVIAQNIGMIPAGSDALLASMTQGSNTEADFQQGMNGEAAAIQAIIDEYNDPATRPLLAEFIRANSGSAGSAGSPSSTEALSQLQWLVQTEQEFANAAQEPASQMQQWLAQKQAEAASMPAASQAVNNFSSAFARVEQEDAYNAMLNAGIALQSGNQTTFQSILDPITGQPFKVSYTANGFVLTSGLQPAGKIRLTFAPPGEK
jgi:hypothetical protein